MNYVESILLLGIALDLHSLQINAYVNVTLADTHFTLIRQEPWPRTVYDKFRDCPKPEVSSNYDVSNEDQCGVYLALRELYLKKKRGERDGEWLKEIGVVE